MNAITPIQSVFPERLAGNISTPRFTALEWLAIASVAQAPRTRDEALLRYLRALYGQCECDPDRRRFEALVGMAMFIARPDARRMVERLQAFLAAGFNLSHLRLIIESMDNQLSPKNSCISFRGDFAQDGQHRHS